MSLDTEKLLSFSQKYRVKVLKNIDEMRELVLAKHDLLGELKQSLIPEWEEKIMPEGTVVFDEKNFKTLLNGYYKALENKQGTFMWGDKELFVGYAKYLLEHAQNQLCRRNDSTSDKIRIMVSVRKRTHDKWLESQS